MHGKCKIDDTMISMIHAPIFLKFSIVRVVSRKKINIISFVFKRIGPAP